MSKKKTAVQKAKIAIIVNAIIPVVIFIALQIWNYVSLKSGQYVCTCKGILPDCWGCDGEGVSMFWMVFKDLAVLCILLLVVLQIPSWIVYIFFKKKASKK